MRFSTVLALVASVAVASATPSSAPGTDFVSRSGDDSSSLTRRAGCGATGPFGKGHYEWYLITSCKPGAAEWCQATDKTGCTAGNNIGIGSVQVLSSDGKVTYEKGKNAVGALKFTCPSNGKIRCQVNLNSDNDGPNYGLRVYNAA
ncbi:hypothetical protein C8Q80DRAFT_1150200 [Daedaleopsis nitida]|nr:hypothetical protein C8Q80DRAFT_1150200 [Daedaleopsis nitida]